MRIGGTYFRSSALSAGKFYFDHSEIIDLSRSLLKGSAWIEGWLKERGATVSDIDSVSSSNLHNTRAKIDRWSDEAPYDTLYLVQVGRLKAYVWFILRTRDNESCFREAVVDWPKPVTRNIAEILQCCMKSSDENVVRRIVQEQVGVSFEVKSVTFMTKVTNREGSSFGCTGNEGTIKRRHDSDANIDSHFERRVRSRTSD